MTVLYCLPPSTSCLSARAYGFQSKSSQWTRQLVQPRVPLELANWCSQELLNGEVVISSAIPRLTVSGLGGTLRLIAISLCESLRFPNACWRSRMFLPAAGRRFPKKRERRPRIPKKFFGVRVQMMSQSISASGCPTGDSNNNLPLSQLRIIIESFKQP